MNICSLGLALVVLDGVETDDDDDFNETPANRELNEPFPSESMHNLLTDNVFHAPPFRELLIPENNRITHRPRISVFDRSASFDIWGESHVSFDDDNEGDRNAKKDDSDSKVTEKDATKHDDSTNENFNLATEKNSFSNSTEGNDTVGDTAEANNTVEGTASDSDNDSDTQDDSVESSE